jgi:hypothetical protein
MPREPRCKEILEWLRHDRQGHTLQPLGSRRAEPSFGIHRTPGLVDQDEGFASRKLGQNSIFVLVERKMT